MINELQIFLFNVNCALIGWILGRYIVPLKTLFIL